MTDYTDVPTVTTLHGEAERTQQAMDMLAAGGTMTNFTIAPPPATGGAPPPIGTDGGSNPGDRAAFGGNADGDQ